MFIQIEVETLDDLRNALNAGAKLILLDNFDLDGLCEAVVLNARLTNRDAALEASGGITLDNVRAVAETGVDRISVGSLTKDIMAVDLSMRFSSKQTSLVVAMKWTPLSADWLSKITIWYTSMPLRKEESIFIELRLLS